nr:neuronal acetylcholine receptor subunit alpha-10-like [Procambarus clarkii]
MVGGPYVMVGGPYVMVGGPYVMVGGPYVMVGGPYVMVGGPYVMVGGTYVMVGGTYVMVGGPYVMVGGPYVMVGGPYVMYPRRLAPEARRVHDIPQGTSFRLIDTTRDPRDASFQRLNVAIQRDNVYCVLVSCQKAEELQVSVFDSLRGVVVWKDKRVRWDPKDYGGLDVLHFGHDELWTPDITVYNNADITEVDHYGNTHLVVYNGWVVWFPPAHISVECPMDISHWPYDTQTCHIYFGSWTTHGWQIELSYPNFTKPLTNRYNLKTSSHWHVNGGTLRRLDFWYEDVPEPYYTMHAEFTITRNSPSFVSTVVLPACVVSVSTLVQFLLPVSHSKRVTVGCTAVLLTLLQLLYLAHAIPPLGTSIPIIVRFYGQTLVVVVTSLVVSGGLLRLTQGPHLAQPPPLSLKKLLTGPLANILFLHDYTEKVGLSGGGAEDGEVLEETRPASYLHEWLLVAAALDRLAAITFVAAFVITLIAYVAPV